MAVSTERGEMLTVTRASLLSLRAALLRSGDAQAAVTLQEAGYAGGTALFESFRSWLSERTHIGVEDLDVDSFQHRASEYFSENGWGTLNVGTIDEVVATLDSPDWGECDINLGAQQPACHLTTGMFADLFGRLAGAPVAVLEVECRSAGHERCRFLVGSPEVMDAVYEEMGRGTDYEAAVKLQISD
ncbi:MAG: V4R domain-containing protein [Vicinamibacterales bacterium]